MNITKDSLLEATLAHVPFDGWSDKALNLAATELGGTTEDAKRFFPRGGIDALLYSLEKADADMLKALEEEYSLETMKVHERVATAVMVRFEQHAGQKDAVRRGLSKLASPLYAAESTKALYHTVDAIWRAAGDSSTDFNFYTKRGLLAKVYMATLLYWLQDDSADLENTRAFLMRRLKNVLSFGKQVSKVKAFVNRYAPGEAASA